MFRKDLLDWLAVRPMSVTEIAREAREKPGDIEDDLKHLLLSLKHTEYEAVIEPATCRKCGFEFGPDKLRKPSRCPKCKGNWLTEPRISVRAKE